MKYLTFMFMMFSLSIFSQEQSTAGPVFDEGAVYDVNSDADFIIDSSTTLKAVFDIGSLKNAPDDLNYLINSLLRFYNLHVRQGAAVDNIHLAFVLHGDSTVDALSDKAYFERFGFNNPNTALIKLLHEKGVKMYVCGQSAMYNKVYRKDMLSEVMIAPSAMTVLTVLQSKGYSLIAF